MNSGPSQVSSQSRDAKDNSPAGLFTTSTFTTTVASTPLDSNKSQNAGKIYNDLKNKVTTLFGSDKQKSNPFPSPSPVTMGDVLTESSASGSQKDAGDVTKKLQNALKLLKLENERYKTDIYCSF